MWKWSTGKSITMLLYEGKDCMHDFFPERGWRVWLNFNLVSWAKYCVFSVLQGSWLHMRFRSIINYNYRLDLQILQESDIRIISAHDHFCHRISGSQWESIKQLTQVTSKDKQALAQAVVARHVRLWFTNLDIGCFSQSALSSCHSWSWANHCVMTLRSDPWLPNKVGYAKKRLSLWNMTNNGLQRSIF